MHKIAVLVILTSLAIGAHGAEEQLTWSGRIAAFCEATLKVFKGPLPPPLAEPKRLPLGMRDANAIRAQVEANLGFKLVLEFAVKKFPFGAVEGEKVTVTDEAGEPVGEFNYFFNDGGGLYLASTDVFLPFRRNGVSEYLFSEVITRHPQTTRLSAYFDADNARAVRIAMAAGKSCNEAMKTSPFYKMSARFGFGEIESAECEGMPQLRLARELPLP